MARRRAWPSGLALEARAGPELASFAMLVGPLLAAAGRGDGHAVIVLPGLGGTDASTAPLRWLLQRLGFRAYGWGLGRNQGFGRRVATGLDELLARAGADREVSLVGWSLGGVHAIELARRRPDAVRSIVTLGSPLAAWPAPPAHIPATSVFSRSDAIVPWPMAQLRAGPRRENLEVRGSHLGLGHNPAAALIVADRLGRRPGEWRPFVAPSWARRWMPADGSPRHPVRTARRPGADGDPGSRARARRGS